MKVGTMPGPGRTRLAPSPTGALHLGNARTFLVTWLLARRHGWSITFRIDDLDGPRVKRGADTAAVDDLRWLGLDWDEGPLSQSARRAVHAAALSELIARRLVYPCVCHRKEIEQAAAAPHAEDGAAVYPGTCRGKYETADAARVASGREPAWRFATNDVPVRFDDAVTGPQTFVPSRDLGDFIVAKADGTPAYQLATVCDDADANVTRVVRGDDLISSTPRQMLLYDAIRPGQTPAFYAHLPLVVGTDGRRLAKRHGDSRLSFYRGRGVTPGQVLRLLGRWCGVNEASTTDELLARFDFSTLPRDPIVFTAADEAELLA
jgi:glutamyl-tRNA synthetase